MRAGLPALLVLLALSLAFVPLAHAQDPDGEPGCPQGNPCEVIVEVDADGFADVEPTTFAAGDWILLSIYNADDADHTLSLEGHSFEETVPAGDIVDTAPFRLGSVGSYDLRDEPSGDSATITVTEEEQFEDDDAAEQDTGIPGPGPVLVISLVAAIALVLRRR